MSKLEPSENTVKPAKRKGTLAIIITLFYLAGIAAAGHAIMTARTATGAVAWSVSLVSFPFVSVPAYLFLGRNKFEGYVEAFEENADDLGTLIDQFRTDLLPWNVEASEGASIYKAVSKLAEMDLTRGNSVELLINGDATFDSILAGVSKAKEYVLFQFYMIHDDTLGRRVQRALIERAQAGVRVYVLYDEIGSGGLTEAQK